MKNNVSIITRRTPHSTHYTVTGTELSVRKWFEGLCRNYHPNGYGTWGQIEEELSDGSVIFKASRGNSCD